MATLATLVVKLVGDTTGFAASMDSAAGKMQKIGGSITGVGKKLTAGLTLPLVGAGAVMVKVAGDFEAQMNVLSTAAGDTGASLDQLRSAAIKVGADTELVGISASEAADAMTNFYKAGLTTSQVMGDLSGYLEGNTSLSGALRAAIDLAAASELDLASASDLVVTTMNTFGLSTDEVVDKIGNYVQAADASVASVSDLAMAMQNAGPTMAAFGFSLEDTNTALAILSSRGITGAEAGTALKSMFVNLMRPTDQVTSTLKELGIALYDAEGNMRSMPDIVANLEKSLAGLTEEQRNQAVQTLAGTYGMKTMQTLLAEGADGWDAMAASIGNATSMQDTAAARTQGFNAALEQLKGAVEAFMIEAGTPLIQNVITPLVQKLGTLIGKLSEADPEFLKMILTIGGVVAVVGPALIIIGQLISALGAIVGVVGAVGGVFSGLAGIVGPALAGVAAAVGTALGPILLIIAAVAAAVLAFKLAWDANFLGIRDLTLQVWEAIKGIIGAAMAFLRGEITFSEMVTRVQEQMGVIWQTILQAWENIKAAVSQALTFIRDWVFNTLVAIVESVLGNHEQAVMIVTTAWERISAIVTAAADLIKAYIDVWLAHIRMIFESTWAVISEVATAAWALIKLNIETILTALKGFIVALLQVLAGDWQGAWSTMKQTAETIVTNMKAGVLGILGSLVEGVYEKGKAIATRFGEGIRNALGKALDAARRMAQELRDLLPGSDAKTGPLRDLGAAGRALPLRFAEGIMATQRVAMQAAASMAMQSAGALGPAAMPVPVARPVPTLEERGPGAGGQGPGAGQPIQITINNPRGEASEASVFKQVRNLGYLGYLNV